MDQESDTPLLAGTVFVTEKRQPQDRHWFYAYVVLLIVSLGGGIFSAVNSNPQYTKSFDPDFFNSPECLASANMLTDEPPPPFWRSLGLWVTGSALGALLLGGAFVLLLKRSPMTMLVLAGLLQLGLPAAAAVAGFASGNYQDGLAWTILLGFMLIAFVLWKDQIKLALDLCRQAAQALVALPGLVLVPLGLGVGQLFVSLPIVISLALAISNGKVVQNPGITVSAGTCTIAGVPDPVPCCEWEVAGWAAPIVTLNAIALIWTSCLASQITLFTVSGAVGQWYFSGSQVGAGRARSFTLVSLRHALGPSLGSLCFSSAVLTLINLIRKNLQDVQRSADTNILLRMLALLASGMLELADFATKFATVRMAITGESFLKAGRAAVDLLRRNAMDAFGVWWLPPLLLNSSVLVFALIWGHLAWVLSLKLAGWPLDASYIFGILSGVAALLVLSFFSSLLLSIVDALFLCFAMDRDRGVVSDPAVHEVMMKLPSVGAVVENPGGDYAYGAPVAGESRV